MHNSKRTVTVFDIIHNNTDGKQVINLVNGFILVYHLFVNGKEMFCPAGYLCLDIRHFDIFAYFFHKSLDIIIPDVFMDSHFFHQVIICV